MTDRSSFEALLRGAADMASFGFGDELSAGVRTLAGGNYSDELAAVRARNAEAQQQHPWAYGAGEVAGLLPMMAVPGAGIARGASLAARIGRGAVAGAVIGGAQGAGSADGGVPERMAGAARGAAVGAGLGGMAPVAGRVVGNAVGRATNNGVLSPRMMNDEIAYAYTRGEELAAARDYKGAAAAIKSGNRYVTQRIKADAIYAASERAHQHPEGFGRGLEVQFGKLMKSKYLNWTPDERRALAKVMHGGGGPMSPDRLSAASKVAMNMGRQPFDPNAARTGGNLAQLAAIGGARLATPSLSQFAERFAGND